MRLRVCCRLFTLLLLTFPLGSGGRYAMAQQGTESFAATHFADLRGEDEVDPVTDTARGIFFARVNVSNEMMRFRLTIGGLSNITGAHIHRGGYGQEGPIVASLDGVSDTTTTVTGTWTMSPGQVDSLLAGFLYVNVHTAAHPAGHIRSQIIPVPNALTPGINSRQVPHSVTDSSGSGESFLNIDPVNKVLYYWIRWRDLTGPPTAAHFHLGPITIEGPPLKTIDLAPGRNITSGSWQLDDTTYDHLLAAAIYINIHTAANPTGEIRGQILPAHVFTSALDPANTVPSRADSSRGGGTGFAVIGIAPFGNFLGAQSIVGGMMAPVQMAHIHTAPTGVEGPVFQPLLKIDGLPYWGIPDGTPRFVSDDTVALFLARGAYMNFHTTMFPGGEVRGQLIPAATNLTLTPSSVPHEQSVNRSLQAFSSFVEKRIVIRVSPPSPHCTVRLHDALGRLLLEQSIQSDVAFIPTAGLSSGPYIVTVEGYGSLRVSIVR